jgi:hypothetical protein
MDRGNARIRGALVATCLAGIPASAVAQVGAELQFSTGISPVHRIAGSSPNAVAIGLAAFAVVGSFQAGPVATFSQATEGSIQDDSLYLGLAAGYTRGVAEQWRIAALAEGGLHRIFDLWDRRLDSYDSVMLRNRVNLPYAGARLGIRLDKPLQRSWMTMGSRLTSFGVDIFARTDLRRGTATVDYAGWRSNGWWWVTETRGVATDRVGGWTAGVALTMSSSW